MLKICHKGKTTGIMVKSMAYFFTVISLLFSTHQAFTQVDSQLYFKTLRSAEQQFNLKNRQFTYPVVISKDTVAKIYFYENGYLVLSEKQDFYPIKAYSNTSIFDTNSTEFQAFYSILTKDYELQIKYLRTHNQLKSKNLQAWQQWANNYKILQDSIGPLLKSEYGQVNCKDENGHYIYVTNYYTPNHYAVGCVALTFTTVMRYFNWPISGRSSHSYTDNHGNSTGTYTADFEHTIYQWQKIQDKYYGVPSTDESRQALGKVAFHAAISVDMDFESTGSTSNINRIPLAASKYFRYDIPIYRTASASDFWDLVDSSLVALSPVQFAVYTSSGAGHAVVCDGVQFTGDPNTQLYHLNMGWWGQSNGWYTIQSEFNAGGYSIISAAVMGMLPVPQIQNLIYDYQNNQIIVNWLYSNKVPDAKFELQIKQNDNGQWQTIATGLTTTTYTFPSDKNSTYYVRVKESHNTNWSEEEKISPLSEINKLKVAKVFPTLARDHIYVQYLNLRNAMFVLRDNQGNEVVRKKFGQSALIKEKVELPNLSTGYYFGQLITQDTTFGFKILILGSKPVNF